MRLLRDGGWLCPGTVVTRFLRCGRDGCKVCRRQGGHGPAYYVSIRGDDGRTHMLYVAKDHLEEVQQAMERYKKVKEGVYVLAHEDLQGWRERTRKKKP